MYVCETTCRCLSKLVSSADPRVQKECLGSGHLGLALPSVSQISFLTHKLSRAGNQSGHQSKPHNTTQHGHTPVSRLIVRLSSYTDIASLIIQKQAIYITCVADNSSTFKDTLILLSCVFIQVHVHARRIVFLFFK